MNSIHGYHDKNSRVAGVWNIIECVSLSGSSEATGIEGTQFLLTESGDVDWKVKEGGQNLPLFECQMYELYTYQNLQCYVNRTLIRFVGYKGHTIEFRLDQPVMSEDLMLLTYDGWFMLQCEKLPSPKAEPHLPYSLLPALQEGFFTDITIKSKSKREFPCHSIVLELSLSSLEWKNTAHSLEEAFVDLEEDVVETLLYYLYSRALPENLLLSTAKRCIISTQHLQDLGDFRKDCLVYGRNTCFRNHFIQIVHTVHESLENILEVFASSSFSSSPSQVIHNLKVVFRHLAIGIVKVLEACMEFEKASEILVLSELRELMKYVRIHVPLLLNELIDILRCIRTTLMSITTHTRQELSLQLVPEIHCAFHTVIYDVTALRKSLEQIIQVSSLSMEIAHSPQMPLANTLQHDLHLRELQKLRILQENLSSLTNSILCKKEQFEEIESNARVRGLARLLELIPDELPDLILRLQQFLHAMDDHFDWSEFQFVFKGATSKIHRILEKLSSHSEIIDNLVQDIVEMVNNSTFSESVAQLGFLKKPQDGHEDYVSSQARDGKRCRAQPQQNLPPSPPVQPLSHEGDKSDLCDGFSEICLADGSPRSATDLAHPKTKEDEGSPQYPPRDLPLFQLPHPVPPSGETGLYDMEVFADSELPDHLQEEGKKLNLVKRVCSLPAGRDSKLASSLLSYLDSDHLVDMTFKVIPPPDDDEFSNSSCESLSTESTARDSGYSRGKEDDHPIAHSDVGYSLANSRHVVRRVKKSFSLDRPSSGSPSRPAPVSLMSDYTNVNDEAVMEGTDRLGPGGRGSSSSFRQSLSLDAESLMLANGSQEGRKRCPLLSLNSDSCDSSAMADSEAAPMTRRSDDSAFESLSQPFEPLEGPQSLSTSRPVRSFLAVAETTTDCEAMGGIELRAHRVVIAARCEWFKRALLSGMREAIDRHIEVPGVSLPVFKLFLVFLYGGKVDLTTLQLDELVDLLVLVDHYGVDLLKNLIEECLEAKVDDDSAIPLMMVAYHCNATKLKDICLQFCALKRSYDMINQLPPELRQQLVSTITNLKKWHRQGLEEGFMDLSCRDDTLGETGWDSPTSIDPLIDDESSSLLAGMHDSASSSEENLCLSSDKR